MSIILFLGAVLSRIFKKQSEEVKNENNILDRNELCVSNRWLLCSQAKKQLYLADNDILVSANRISVSASVSATLDICYNDICQILSKNIWISAYMTSNGYIENSNWGLPSQQITVD